MALSNWSMLSPIIIQLAVSSGAIKKIDNKQIAQISDGTLNPPGFFLLFISVIEAFN